MNNQKDIQRTDIKKYGQPNVSDNKALSNMGIYDVANKKTEKLVTALYLVSDCMDTDDALKGKIRLLGVELLSDIYRFSVLSPVEKSSFIGTPVSRVYELLSFIEIAKTVGFISEMNASILKKEFSRLATDLRETVSKDRHFTFTLDEKMFELGELNSGKDYKNNSFLRTQNNIKDMSLRNISNRHDGEEMSFMNNRSPIQISKEEKYNNHQQQIKEKESRTNKIISLITEKKDVSIKDISLLFSNVSEKTIQRELNLLVSKGQLKKTGSKRWSRYHLAKSS